MEYPSSKHKELSEQLTGWWDTQTDFGTKKALAEFLNVHPDTVGDYFSGRKFPRLDIANKLCELTKIMCLQDATPSDSFSEKITQEASIVSLLPPPTGGSTPISKLKQPGFAGPPSPSKEKDVAEKIPAGARYKERSVVISLERTNCPFCAHSMHKFRDCLYCGQHFAWANVPLKQDESL